MDLLYSILNFIWTVIKGIFSNPYSAVAVVMIVIIKIFYRQLRGFMGEFWVKVELNKLQKRDYIVLNNIMIEQNNSTHQIDHLVISKFGIFVIEMKNYYGMIVGDDQQSKWIQCLGRNKFYFNNPIYQNYGHVKALEEILNLNVNYFIPIVCFSNQAKLKIRTNNSIVQLNNLISLINNFTLIQINDDINSIANKINQLNITDKNARKKHVQNIRTKLEEDEMKADNMICPKCGGKLVPRNGKYGTFIGCSNYPKCRYISKA